MMIQGIVTALSVGMGCGTCCGSGVSAVLFGYLTTHAKGMKHAVRAFFSFYLGKILAVAFVCMGSSLLGRQILREDGSIGPVNIHRVMDLCMIAIGLWMVIRWIRENRHDSCSHCKGCHESGAAGRKIRRALGIQTDENPGNPKKDPEKPKTRVNHLALAVMGAGYGISPCAPLIMMAGYAATLGLGAALLTGCIFAAASAFVPMVLMMFLSGILSSGISREIPQYLNLFRLLSYVLLIVVFAIDLLA